jgi:mannose-6-phosphate isomerase-like protein (cupin superfamily)
MSNLLNNIEKETLENTFFRKVLLTTPNQQLVVMHLNPLEDIGEEKHGLDQFIKIESGEGKAILDGQEFNFSTGFSISIPQGTVHNIINTSNVHPIKLYTIYSPANHKDGTIHKTKAEAMADESDHPEKINF